MRRCTCHHPNPGFACVADVHRSAPADIAAAREEGRREGYAQALADDLVERRKAGNCPSCGWAGGHSNACGVIADADQRGYDACTADAAAWLESNAREGGDDEAEQSRLEARAIRAGDHVGAAGKARP